MEPITQTCESLRESGAATAECCAACHRTGLHAVTMANGERALVCCGVGVEVAVSDAPADTTEPQA